MKKLLVLILFGGLIILSGCQKQEEYSIITTSFISYDITKNITQDKQTIHLLVPPGVDYHDYQITSNDLIYIKKSKLLIFLGFEYDTYFEDQVRLESIISSDTKYVNLFDEYSIHIENHHEHEDDDHEHEHQHEEEHDHGIHFWTDPHVFVDLIDSVLESIILIDPSNEQFYRENASAYQDKINTLTLQFEEYLNTKEEKNIFYTGHNALEPFADHFGITINALSQSQSPNADITSPRFVEFINLMKTHQAKVLFTEELKSHDTAKSIQNKLQSDGYQITIKELHGYHAVAKEQLDANITYYDLLLQNINNLKEAI